MCYAIYENKLYKTILQFPFLQRQKHQICPENLATNSRSRNVVLNSDLGAGDASLPAEPADDESFCED